MTVKKVCWRNMPSVFWGESLKLALAVVAAISAMAAQAAKVTDEMALAAAEAWAAENKALSGDIGLPVSVKERRDDGGKLLWYEVAMSGGGCIVASADTEIEPIVAVIGRYEGEIEKGHPLETMLLADMGKRLSVLAGESVSRKTPKASGASAARTAEVQTSAADAARKWAKLTGGASKATAKGGVLQKGSTSVATPATVVRYLPDWATNRLTFWSQFSTYTPKNYPAGCVATAGAALLQFFNVTSAPNITNYCWVDGVKTSLSTKGIDYDWSIMPEENASFSSFTDEQKDVARRAVYDMGVCLGMSYRSGGSGAAVYDLADVLRTRYGFADTRYVSVSSGSASLYEKLIYEQIRCGAPVVLGISRSGGGHAVIAVGYGEDGDSTAYTRVFMGWGGSSDAWYALPNVADYTIVDEIITMIGTTSDTMAVCGRVTAESGAGAAYVDVSVNGNRTVETDEKGYWGVRVTPTAGTLTCSCGGTVKSATVGANAAIVESYSASNLSSALPGPIDFTVSDADALVVYSSPSEAVRAALREGKILMVLLGYDTCGGCVELKDHIKGMGSGFTSDFVLFYANTQANGDFGLEDETCSGVPYWGTFDPRVWKLEERWAADNGRFTLCHGYSSSSTTYYLDSARSQWSGLNAAPAAMAVASPDQITMPTVLTVKLSFPDGTETLVRDGLTWSIVSGTAATITGGDMLTPVDGASGNVTVRCEGYFWNSLYTATKTIRIIDGVVATGLVIEGPEVVDLLKVDGAQFSAKAILSDGSQVEVPVCWDVTEANETNCTMSASGYISFKKRSYAESSTVRVSASYGDCSAFSDLTVWGASAKVYKYTLSDTCAWPGKTVTLTIDKVQWWRHGVWEEPTEDFSGVGVHWYYFVGMVNCYQTSSIGTSRTISFTVPADKNDGSTRIEIHLRTSGRSLDDFGVRWMTALLQYVPAEPSQMVTVTFDGNGGEPAERTATYAVGCPYGGFPAVSRTGHYLSDWYTAAEGGTRITTSSNCLASVTRLYAHWNRKYCHTTYDANGGTGSMYDSWFYYGSTERLQKNAFTKVGSMFAGWATSPGGPVVYQDEAEMLYLSDNIESLSLYAVWVENGYKVVFDANGGTGEMAPQMCSIGTCSSLGPSAFTRRGATFVGWSRTPDGNVEIADCGEVCDLATACGETVTLYAVWNLPDVAAIDLAGPDVIDLYDVESAQFTATCRYANGSEVDVAPKWTIEETAVTNAVISADGLVTFPAPAEYTKASRLKVTVECNGVSASKEVDVWGWSVSLSSWTTPRRVVWPGQPLEIVPQAVTWWRHGVTESPTTDFTGVDFSIGYGWVNSNTYLNSDNATSSADGLALQIPSSVSEPAGRCYVYVEIAATRLGNTVANGIWPYFKYLPSAPSQTVDVTFIADGGVPATQTTRYAVGSAYGYLPEPVRTGYYFSDWYTAADDGTMITGSSDCRASVTCLYARWTPKQCYVAYNANGGTGSMYASWFNYGSPANLRKNAFAKAGAMFAGWATSPDGPVVYQDEAEMLYLSDANETLVLYAVWSTDFYTVEFDANGGTGETDAQTALVGSCITIPSCSIAKTGYTFAGWAMTRDGEEKFSAGASVCDLGVSSGDTVVLYAVWTANTYNVTLNQQSGSGGTSSVTATYESAMPAITVPVRSGYTFEGYYASTGGNGAQYYNPDGSSARVWDVPAPATLYADWKEIPVATYTVTYDPGAYGTGTRQTASKIEDVALVLAGALFERTGYVQTGWAASDGGAKEYDLGGVYTANADITLYPVWTENAEPGGGDDPAPAPATYTVTYAPGLCCEGMQQTAFKIEDVALTLAGALFERTGYVQTGWAASDGGAKEYDLGGTYTANADVTLYPVWTSANPGGGDTPYGTPVFTIVDGLLVAVDLNGATEVEIPDGVTGIREEVFEGCSSLTSVTIPDSVADIGYDAFSGCDMLYDTGTVPGLVLVDGWAVGHGDSLAGTCGFDGVRGIAAGAIMWCEALTGATIPDSVKSIGEDAFCGCEGLTDVSIGAGVGRIGEEAFSWCSSLRNIAVDPDNPAYCSKNGMLLAKDGKTLLQGVNGDVTIPSGVVVVGRSAFYGCSSLTGVEIPEGVAGIGDCAFEWCEELVEVDVPDSVLYIGDGAFYECSALAGITIGAGVARIGEAAFQSCASLESIVFLGDAPEICEDTFYDVPDGCTVYVGKNSAGWGVAIPGTWNRMRIEYNAEDPDPTPGPVTPGPAPDPDPAQPDPVTPGPTPDPDPAQPDPVSPDPDPAQPDPGTDPTPTPDPAQPDPEADPTPDPDPEPAPEPSAELVWHTNWKDAVSAASATGKRILLVSGRDTCPNTMYLKNEACEDAAVKARLALNFVTWYNDCDNQWYEIWDYAADLSSYALPLVCVLDPADMSSYVVRSTGFLDAEGLSALLDEADARKAQGSTPVSPDPGAEPEPTPSPTPSADPTPSPAPSPAPTPGTGSAQELYETVAGAAPAAVASEYNGCIMDAKGDVKGTILVKVGKANAKTGEASVKATAAIGAKKVSLKAEGGGKAAISATGPTTIALTGGDACTVTFGEDGLSGRYGPYTIDGARNFFTSKNRAELSAANALLGRISGPINVVWSGGSASLSVAARGKVKVKGTLADGKTKVTASAVILVGEDGCCIPVVAPKANLAFALWLSGSGGVVAVDGLGDGVVAGEAGTLQSGAKFRIDTADALWSKLAGKVLASRLPDGVAVSQSGAKWILPKAGKVAYVKGTGEVDAAKAGENPAGLKLTYKAKEGSFKGSFKVYADNGGRLRATTVDVAGVMVGGKGYGTATVRKTGSVAITIE